MSRMYIQRDLGYYRTPTKARYLVTMPDGNIYAVPLQLIVDDRDASYVHDKEDTVGSILAGTLDVSVISDWASGNMNWDDVKKYAELYCTTPMTEEQLQEGWVNGKKRIIEI